MFTLNSLLLFVHNFDANFIQEIWGYNSTLSEHFQGKYNDLSRRHSGTKLMIEFLSQLSDENLKCVEEYIAKNHKN